MRTSRDSGPPSVGRQDKPCRPSPSILSPARGSGPHPHLALGWSCTPVPPRMWPLLATSPIPRALLTDLTVGPQGLSSQPRPTQLFDGIRATFSRCAEQAWGLPGLWGFIAPAFPPTASFPTLVGLPHLPLGWHLPCHSAASDFVRTQPPPLSHSLPSPTPRGLGPCAGGGDLQ